MAVSLTLFAETRMVGEFSATKLNGWQEKVFDGNTTYQPSESTITPSLKAISNNSASGLFREIKIDLEKTPYLNWSWKIENVLNNQQEQSKQGDDYPARVYIVFSGGLFFWQTRALNYVWSSHQPVNTHWPNAYTGNAQMIAVEGGDEHVGEWRHEKRNVMEDYKKVFGKLPKEADAIAIMTDTDNTGQRAVSYYGDLYLTDK
jgi:hypothetical protein